MNYRDREREKRTAKGVVGHAEEREAIGSKYVKDVHVLRETESRISLRRQLLQDPPRHRACIPRDRAELRQHHRPSSHHSVQYSHLALSLSLSLSLFEIQRAINLSVTVCL